MSDGAIKLRVDGEVDAPRDFGWDELAHLDGQVPDVGALVPGRQGGGVRLASLLAAASARAEAAWATLFSADGRFSISVPLAPLGDALVAYRLGDAPLPDKQGGPLRFLIPDVDRCGGEGVDACANVKALGRIHLTRAKDPSATHHH